MNARIAAAIIAGGRARRFGGRDKSRLLVQGVPIINRQIPILQQLAAHLFIVSSDAARFADLGVPIHADLVQGAGALGGIYTALEAAPTERVVIVACDLPFLDLGLLQALAERCAHHDAAWIRSGRGPEPLLACYRRSARQVMRQQIDAGHLKVADLGAVLDVAELTPADVEQFGPADLLLANLNTPEDWERIGS